MVMGCIYNDRTIYLLILPTHWLAMVPPCISFNNIVLLFFSTAAGAIAATTNWSLIKNFLISCPVIGWIGGWMDMNRILICLRLFQSFRDAYRKCG